MPKTWTDQEITFIREHKAQMTNKQLSEKLGCSGTQLSYAIKKYRLKRSFKEINMLTDKIMGREYRPRSYYRQVFTRVPKES
jgi:DNA-binding Lrp family transcriptional regulator